MMLANLLSGAAPTAVAPGRTRVIVVSLFHTREERDGMLQSGMEAGLNRSYDVLDAMLASLG